MKVTSITIKHRELYEVEGIMIKANSHSAALAKWKQSTKKIKRIKKKWLVRGSIGSSISTGGTCFNIGI